MSETREMTREEKIDYYHGLCHAVQTGIAWKLAIDHPDCPDVNADPNLRAHKHLRVGIDTAKSDHGALVNLLVQKGIITDDEYIDNMILFMEKEKYAYEKELSEKYDKNITLG